MKLCLDIGGTNIRGNIFKDNSKVCSFKFTTFPNNFDKSIKEIQENITGYKISLISIGMPGPANYKEGIFLEPPNLKGWWNKNIKNALEKITGVSKILCTNDAKLMALANHKNVGGTKKDITQFFTISTGLGAGLIINNEIYEGFSGLAQEVAYIPINSSNEKNSYSVGAVEYFSSGSGIAKRARKFGFLSTQEVFKSYRKDKNAKKIIDEAKDGLANLIASSIALINPNILIFDGSVARYNNWFIKESVELAKMRMYSKQGKSFKWYISKLGDDSVLLGALERIKNV